MDDNDYDYMEEIDSALIELDDLLEWKKKAIPFLRMALEQIDFQCSCNKLDGSRHCSGCRKKATLEDLL